ncbi:MAG: MBL fold metallo-hydrolase [Rhodothalassiaceae bacterium]
MPSAFWSRRRFLLNSLASGAGLTAAAHLAPAGVRQAFAQTPLATTITQEPFARLEQIADGVWAVVSTPFNDQGGLGDPRTLANGGLIAGSDHVLAVEAFWQPAGAAWLAEQSEQLTGKRPTHVVLSHYHADHSAGIAGYDTIGAAPPQVIATRTTYDTLIERYGQPQTVEDAPFKRVRLSRLPSHIIPLGQDRIDLDLGGRTVALVMRHGHTASDISIELADPPVIFAGDLVWQGIFPNFTDSAPSALSRHVAELAARAPETVIVPGHGSLIRPSGMGDFQAVLETLEQTARAAHQAGNSVEAAAEALRLPEAAADWTLFNPRYYELAMAAWYRELG